MRDAFGGAFMIQVFLVFILIYVGFTAMALNYAKAFKVKNAVIDYLENSEITDLGSLNSTEMEAMDSFFNEEILGNMNYKSSNNVCNDSGSSGVLLRNAEDKVYGYCHSSGIVIEQSGVAENTEGVYYTVSTYVRWSLPFLNNLLALNGNNQEQEVPAGIWEISGQTRLIVND